MMELVYIQGRRKQLSSSLIFMRKEFESTLLREWIMAVSSGLCSLCLQQIHWTFYCYFQSAAAISILLLRLLCSKVLHAKLRRDGAVFSDQTYRYLWGSNCSPCSAAPEYITSDPSYVGNRLLVMYKIVVSSEHQAAIVLSCLSTCRSVMLQPASLAFL